MSQTTMYAGIVNSPYTLLSAGITDVATTIPVLELGVFPAAPNIAVIGTGSDAETIYYGGKSAATGPGNLTSVTREWNKTGTIGAKKAWLAGTVISRRFTEYDHAAFKANIEDHETWKISKAIVDAKGDLIVATGADTVVRHPVGPDYYPLVAKSSATNGIAYEPLTEAGIVLADVTTLDVSTTKHGLVPKAPNDTTKYLRGDGTWAELTTPDILIFKGTIDCGANPNYPTADAGHVYLVSVAGKIGGAAGPDVEIGDMIICHVDSSASGDHATVGANWSILQKSAVDEGSISLSDVTTNDASTSKHGFAPKATAPAAGIINLLGIANGETAYTCKALLDDTNPEALGTAGPGTATVAARRDHVHAMPSIASVFTWAEVTGTTQALAVNKGYILNHATTMVVATLPSTAAVGDTIRIVGKGAAMWKVAQNASQYIRFAGLTTTTGTGGYLQAENRDDCIELLCTTANNGWTVISSIGNIVVV